jgi:hypothetical protein
MEYCLIMSNITVNTITPRTTSNVDIQGISKPTYLTSPIALTSETVQLAGSTMTGPLVLPGNAASALQAVPKQQLDAAVALGARVTATNGYYTLPPGILLQWGTYSSNISIAVGSAPTPVAITFPTAFPTACLNIQVSTRDPSNDYVADSWPAVGTFTASGFNMVPQNTGNAGTNYTLHGFTWFAIGY